MYFYPNKVSIKYNPCQHPFRIAHKIKKGGPERQQERQNVICVPSLSYGLVLQCETTRQKQIVHQKISVNGVSHLFWVCLGNELLIPV